MRAGHKDTVRIAGKEKRRESQAAERALRAENKARRCYSGSTKR